MLHLDILLKDDSVEVSTEYQPHRPEIITFLYAQSWVWQW